MDNERLKKQVDFILEIDKAKNVLRKTHITDYIREENDAEHAWHMAIMVYLLKEYANEEFDLSKAMMMALIHDIVEIDAGDTYAYDSEDKKTQKEREEKAMNRIFAILPEDQKEKLKELFLEFEKCQSNEAKFVRAMDNFQPLLLNDKNGGKDWKDRKIRKSQVLERQEKTKPGSQKIWEASTKIVADNTLKGNLIDE